MSDSSRDSTEVANCDTGCHIKVWTKERRGRWDEFREGFPEEVTFSQTLNNIIQFGVLGSFFQLAAKFPCDLKLVFSSPWGPQIPFCKMRLLSINSESFESQPPLRRISESQSPSCQKNADRSLSVMGQRVFVDALTPRKPSVDPRLKSQSSVILLERYHCRAGPAFRQSLSP